MVEVNGAYRRGKYEKLYTWLKSLHVMFNVKVFVTQD